MRKIVKRMIIASKLVGESVMFALSSLKTDKFRTFLSLLGVCIGIFSVVAVFCAVEAMQTNIKKGLNSFGSNVIYIQEYPWVNEEDPAGEYKWWEYRKRPPITEDEFNFMKQHSTTAGRVVYMASFYKLLTNGRNSFANASIVASTSGIENVANVDIEQGRMFSQNEIKSGANVVVIGNAVLEALFPDGNAIGKTMKIGNSSAVVIGLIKKQGSSMVSVFDMDNAVVIPLNFGKTMFNVARYGGMLIMAPKETVDKEEFMSETKHLMRSIRRLQPEQKNNFAVNEMTFIIDSVSRIMGLINTVGLVIGGFSLLIGGFGIANIMFVSVKERTNQIGIQKALGAKRYVIMTQFLVESAVLSVAGGILGILLVFIVTLFFRNNENLPLALSLASAAKGLVVAIVIGVISGIIPAYTASNLDPVKAINA